MDTSVRVQTLRRAAEIVGGPAQLRLYLNVSALCLAAYGQDAAPVLARLRRAWTRTHFLADTRSIALAVLAMSDGARAVAP